jgi:mannose-1-phosphate guanylyltransferase
MLTNQAGRVAHRSHWGLVLAAGEGIRLQEYIRLTLGRQLPKQYVNFIGRRSMIEHTFARAEKVIAPQNLITIVSRRHLEYGEVRRQLASRPSGTVIVQPANKETGPGILLPLVHIYKRCPEAIVSVFPSDPFILEEDRFMTHVELAAEAVARNPARIVLLAMEAHSPEEEYGYVIPAGHTGEIDLHGTRPVARFVEKPNRHTAQDLVDGGALWNTMVMVFKARTLLQMVERLDPDTYQNFNRILNAAGTSREQETTDAVYGGLEPINFSKGILERLSRADRGAVTVLPVLQVYWSDWGSPTRLLVTQRLLGVEPELDCVFRADLAGAALATEPGAMVIQAAEAR